MGFSKKEINIITLLVVDSVFFLLEIIVGYAVNSLALIADSFHMLNDIVSLIVALWAVNVAKTREADARYTYGWQRAEILGALINAVFLLALCFTIFVEAVQRFIMPQEVSNPKLILFVGTCGLLSNIAGLFLFHEHGHSHGGMGGHSHSHVDEEEEVGGQSHEHSHTHADNIETHSHSHASSSEHGHETIESRPIEASNGPSEQSSLNLNHGDVADILPEIVVKRIERASSPDISHSHSHSHSHAAGIYDGLEEPHPHQTHNHVLRKTEEGNKKSLNMHGVFLHVLGDALGNVGVMATAVFIWQTNFSWRFYSDPLVSLIITIIIFSSALPLCKSASRILLQGTPTSVSLDDVRDDIMQINGVISIHDFHVWNLTENHLIASLHVDLSISPESFLDIAKTIKECLHAYGIHSATIQPEFTHYYAKTNKLPKRFSTQTNLPTMNSINGDGPSNEATSLLPKSNSKESPNYGSNVNSNGDFTCIVDAAGGCTSDHCVKK